MALRSGLAGTDLILQTTDAFNGQQEIKGMVGSHLKGTAA